MKDPSGTINFEIGQPSADLLPVDLIRLAADNYLSTAESIELNYGDKQGDPRFRETLAVFLGRAYGEKVTAQSLFVTAGNSQALDFVCTQFTRPGAVFSGLLMDGDGRLIHSAFHGIVRYERLPNQ